MAATTQVVSARTAAGGRLFFSNRDTAHGEELWVSDGTVAGTRMLTDLNPGAGEPRPLGLGPGPFGDVVDVDEEPGDRATGP